VSAPLAAVFFDVDDTLIDYAPAARAALIGALGDDVDHAVWGRLPHYERYLLGELDFPTFRQGRMSEYLTLAGRAADVERAAEIEALRFDALVANCRLFDDVPAALEALRVRGLRLGLITNNDGVHQREKLAAVGLGEQFDAIVISGEVGVPKPRPEIFVAACAALGVEPAQALHVGDNLDADYRGARDAGLAAVWLNRSGRESTAPDVVQIAGLDTLESIVTTVLVTTPGVG
jgi:putative hydrolase of the HAD superfamily